MLDIELLLFSYNDQPKIQTIWRSNLVTPARSLVTRNTLIPQHTHPSQSKSENSRSFVSLIYSFTKQVFIDSFCHYSKPWKQNSEQNRPSTYNGNNNVISQKLVCISSTEIILSSSLDPIFLTSRPAAGLWALLKELAHKVPLRCLTYVP